MKISKVLYSELDSSVNFVFDNMMEARYVQRTPEYFICYLSSHDGCNKACRFCHLTQTGQTSFNEATVDDYITQAIAVLDHYRSKLEEGMPAAKHVNFNFMSRGEPLSNNQLINGLSELNGRLRAAVEKMGLTHSLNISSIIPQDADLGKIKKAFVENKDNLLFYYSLYSLDSSFRKRWIPKSLEPCIALNFLKDLQSEMGLNLVLHWALIQGENDSIQNAQLICDQINSRELKARFNLVRYNPYSQSQGEEATECSIQEFFEIMKNKLGDPNSRIVPKVGFDVKASCGMFVG